MANSAVTSGAGPDVVDADGNVWVVMYYYPTDDSDTSSAVNIFDCHVCGQKFRVFPRIEQHYLKKHGCVVVKCGEDGAEPRISCPALTVAKASAVATASATASNSKSNPAAASVADAFVGAGKRRGRPRQQRQTVTKVGQSQSQCQSQSILNFLTPKPKTKTAKIESETERELEPQSQSQSQAEFKSEAKEPTTVDLIADEEGVGVPVATTVSVLDNENEQPTNTPTPNSSRPKCARAVTKRRRRRRKWGSIRAQTKPKPKAKAHKPAAAPVNENTFECTTPGAVTDAETDSLHSFTATATPLDTSVADWEVKLDSPAVLGKLKLKNGRAKSDNAAAAENPGAFAGFTTPAGLTPASRPFRSPRTPFAVLSTNASTPAVQTTRRIIVGSSSSSSSSSSSFSSSSALRSRSATTKTRDSRYARRLEAKEQEANAIASAKPKVTTPVPRKLELTDDVCIKTAPAAAATEAEAKPEEDSFPTDADLQTEMETSGTKAEAPDEHENERESEIYANVNSVSGDSEVNEAKATTSEATVQNLDFGMNSKNSSTESEANDNFAVPVQNENTTEVGTTCIPSEVDTGLEGNFINTSLTLGPEIEAELLEFLARETWCGQPNLGFADTASVSADFDLSDILDFLEERAELETETVSSVPALSLSEEQAPQSEVELFNETENCQTPSPMPDFQIEQAKSPDVENRKRKMFDGLTEACAGADFRLLTPPKKARLLPEVEADADVELHAVVADEADDDDEEQKDKENRNRILENMDSQKPKSEVKQDNEDCNCSCGLGEDSFHSTQGLDWLSLKLGRGGASSANFGFVKSPNPTL